MRWNARKRKELEDNLYNVWSLIALRSNKANTLGQTKTSNDLEKIKFHIRKATESVSLAKLVLGYFELTTTAGMRTG